MTPDVTPRDRVWAHVLKVSAYTEEFSTDYIREFVDAGDSTVYDVLDAMVALDVLEVVEKGSGPNPTRYRVC